MGKRISIGKSPRRIAGAVLVLVCFVLWVVYLVGDFGRLFPTNAPKFTLVSLTCAFAVLSFVLDVLKPEKDRFLPDLLLVFALVFTLISDVFLLLVDVHRSPTMPFLPLVSPCGTKTVSVAHFAGTARWARACRGLSFRNLPGV